MGEGRRFSMTYSRSRGLASGNGLDLRSVLQSHAPLDGPILFSFFSIPKHLKVAQW